MHPFCPYPLDAAGWKTVAIETIYLKWWNGGENPKAGEQFFGNKGSVAIHQTAQNK